MWNRAAAGLIALFILGTSGTIGRTVYLCLMSSGMGAECCCEHQQVSRDGSADTIERPISCCEPRVTEAAHHPARHEEIKNGLAAKAFVATLPIAIPALTRARLGVAWLPDARGPPSGRSSPIFVWTCQYLI